MKLLKREEILEKLSGMRYWEGWHHTAYPVAWNIKVDEMVAGIPEYMARYYADRRNELEAEWEQEESDQRELEAGQVGPASPFTASW